MTTAQQRMGADNYGKMRQWITQKESGGNYASLQNTPLYENGVKVADNVDSGYRGAYQMGASYAKEAGLIKSTSGPTEFGTFGKTQLQRAEGHKAFMNNDANWNDPPGNLQNFLSGPRAKEIQDQAFDRVTEKNYQSLVANKVIKPEMPPDEVAGHLMGAHAAGVKGYTEFVNGDTNRTDGAGTRVSTYYNGASAAVSGKAPPPSGNKTAQNGKPSDDKTATDSAAQRDGSNRTLVPTKIGNKVSIGGTTKKQPPIPLPFSNVLSEFSSYNSVITISCISSKMHDNPKSSYKNGNIGSIILRSAGAGDQAGESAVKTTENPQGKYDFGINNVELSSQITFNPEFQASNAYEISFDVYEPYSMGLFMQVCNNAAFAQGWPGFLNNAVFLLTFEFIGYDSNGSSIKVPNTTRHIPFTFKDIKMTASAGGAVYRVQAHPSNEMVLLNNVGLFEHDIGIEGSTVQEALQSGPKSLQTIVNKRLQEFAAKTKKPTAYDEIVIIFPDIGNTKTLGTNQQGQNIGQQIRDETGAISNFRFNPETGKLYDATGIPLQQPGVAQANPNTTVIPETTISRTSSAANLIQDTNSLNVIGISALEFDSSMAAESGTSNQNDVQIDPANPISRKRVTYDKNRKQFVYSQGTSIVNAISSILLHSKYCRSGLDAQKTDAKGMIPWFRIEPAVYFQRPKEGNIGDNNVPKLLVYKVVPYFVHSERNSANAAAPAGLQELATEVAKVYDYLYTGKNTEILNFNIEFQQALFNAMAKDDGMEHKDTTSEGRNGDTYFSNDGKQQRDNTAYYKNTNIGNVTSGGPVQQPDVNGGLRANDDQKLKTAKTFQRALNDSETDLVEINFTIIGDPYYLADSGMGNFSNTGSGSFNVTSDLAMDHQSGEVDIAVNFRTPIDYNSSTGLMEFGDTAIVKHFSGLYRVLEVKHRFQNGKFTQDLRAQRRRNQTAESTNKPVPGSNQALVPNQVPVNNPSVEDQKQGLFGANPPVDTSAPGRLDNGGGGVAFAQGRTSPGRVAAFNRSDLANAPGGTELSSATADPFASPGVRNGAEVELLKTKVMTTLFTPTKSNNSDNASEFSSGNA